MRTRLPISLSLALACVNVANAAGRLPEPISYTKPINRDLIFVMLGDPEIESKLAPHTKNELQELRQRYPQSGLYHTQDGRCLWSLNAPYVPYDNVFLTTDGNHLVRLEGDWWIERDYPSPSQRLAAEEEQRQLNSDALSFYYQGQRIRSYALQELITNPRDLKHSPRYVLWAAGGVLLEPENRFVVMTQDATRISFDVRTGERLATDRIGLNNPILPKILLVCAGVSLIIFLAWLSFALRTRPIG
jgi:hypothetical protein